MGVRQPVCGRRSVKVEAAEEGGPGVSPRLLAPAGFGFGVALFLLTRTVGGVATLSELASSSVPLDVALSNGRPSVVEFYADWCEVCKSVASDSAQIKDRYGDQVNFVMLNVDNPKWAEEVAEYHVDGIPHWEYLNARGEPKGFVVGNLPKEILEANARSLGAAGDLPYARQIGGSASRIGDGPSKDETRDAMPRDHG